MINCGWWFSSVPQQASVAAMMGPLGVEVRGDSGLHVLNLLKAALVQIKKNWKGAKPSAMQLVWTYPANPKELPEPWKTKAFANGDLVPSPVDLPVLNHHLSQMRCRGRGDTKATKDALSMGGLSPNQQLG